MMSVIGKIHITVYEDIDIDKKYSKLFNGNLHLKKGHHQVRYPIASHDMQKLMSDFMLQYKQIRVDPKVCGTEEFAN